MDISELEAAPRVVIGGREWPVPMLAARQNKIIDPLILGLLPVFAQWQSDKEAALSKLGRKEYDALLEIALTAIRRAHPELTHEEFMDMPVTLPELIGAFSVIAQQTGVFSRASAEDRPPGEARAGNARSGTPSSPMSAI